MGGILVIFFGLFIVVACVIGFTILMLAVAYGSVEGINEHSQAAQPKH